jgi:hypothetical protein
MKSFSLKAMSLLAVLAFLFSSCGGGGDQQESTSSNEGDEFDEAKSQVISNINNVIKDLPPPSEVPYLLMATGTDFDASLVNSLEGIEKYSTPSTLAAINLGVYITDVGYLTSYEKAQETLEYVSACQRLSEDIGVASAMDMRLMSRFERNLNNKDSLKVLVDEVINRTSERLDAIDRMNVAGLVLAGSYVEGLYVSTKLIENFDEDLPALLLEPLIKIIIDQRPAVDDLLIVMEDLKGQEAIDKMTMDLNKIKDIYDTDLAEVSKAISENTGDLILTKDMLTTLTSTVTEVRNSYTN